MAEENNAFLEYGIKAREEHIRYTESILPGFVAFECDIDVKLGLWHKTMHKGTYFLLADEVRKGSDNQNALVYMFVPDAEQMIDEAERVGYDETIRDDGTIQRTIKPDAQIHATIEPIELEEGRYLSFLEFIAWLAIGVAESNETRDAIFHSAYTVDTGESSQGHDEDLPRQDTAKPRKRQDPKTKIARFIGIPEKNAELYKENGALLAVAGGSEKAKDISVNQAVAIEYRGADGIIAKGREQLTQLDRQVHNAIISHYVAGNRIVSLVQICELVYGHAKPTAEQRRDVEECIERQMWTRISIDMAEEAAHHTLKKPDLLTNFKLEGQMLAIQKMTEVRAANGKKIVAYRIMGEPILFTHAQVTGQIITYSTKLLQAPKGMKNTEKTMAIRETMLEEIRRAKNGRRSRFIKYDTLYEDSGQIPNSRTERTRQNKAVRGYLDLFMENGEITSWKERKEGRKITGFEVFFSDKSKSTKAAKSKR